MNGQNLESSTFHDERGLFAAIIMQAIRDAATKQWHNKGMECTEGKCDRLRPFCARDWFFGKDDHLTSFRNCCRIVGMDADTILRGLRRRGVIKEAGE